jgi:hypothetical protein
MINPKNRTGQCPDDELCAVSGLEVRNHEDPMKKLIAIATLFVLIGTAAQATNYSMTITNNSTAFQDMTPPELIGKTDRLPARALKTAPPAHRPVPHPSHPTK